MLGVMGHPIGHSLSPEMHNAALRASGADFVYVPMEVAPNDLAEAVRGLRALGFRGFNVTMPHKEAIIPLLNELGDVARISGAVNTVVIEGGKMRGLNTDGGGFLEACREAGAELHGKRILVAGAGGASAAVCAAVLGESVKELCLVNRTLERAERLAARLREAYPRTEILVRPIEELEEAASGAEVLVNTTYLGMKDGDSLPFSERSITGSETVCDAVYRTREETATIKAAREHGKQIVTGARMLVYQGVRAYRVWTGEDPDVELMGRAVL